VIYSGGLRPYLFSISLMLGSGFPPALPWPTGHRVWVGPLRNCLEPAPQTHSPSLFRSLLLSLCFSPFLLLRPCFMYTISQSLSQHPSEILRHSCLFTLSGSPPLSHSGFLASHAQHLTPASSTLTCKHPRMHTQALEHGLHRLQPPSILFVHC